MAASGSSGGGDTDYLSRADGESINSGIIKAILAPILATGSGVAMLIDSGLRSFSDIFDIFGDVRTLVGAFFTSPTTALEMAAQATGMSSQQFGILAIPIVMASIALGLVLVDVIWGGEIPIVSAINPLS
ncbi:MULTISPECIES: hypothetical protein [Halorubrum]|uniref:Uncharacterized protein n=1 Tax=Halorubrum hochstenium ATCC 700873 TaxID=1227481 RepID=M0FDR8_9EURY|nr:MULTISPECIES: hypothetical protein [Halorubrum]ELZ56769.1 hypothetical protein C467_07847 [Halorubrum hochstenium ATCC 700873]